MLTIVIFIIIITETTSPLVLLHSGGTSRKKMLRDRDIIKSLAPGSGSRREPGS